MKNISKILLMVSLLLAPALQADTIGFEVGGYYWVVDHDGTLSSDSSESTGTTINMIDDLAHNEDSHNVFYAALEHPVPMLPNLKITSTDLLTSSASTLTRDVTFGGSTYSQDEDVASIIDMSNTEYTVYYELLDNWVNLDLGLSFRKYDGLISMETDPAGSAINELEDLDFTIPLLYVSARFDLPLTGFFIGTDLNIISYDDDSLSDAVLSLGYESDIGLGARAGYRIFSLEVIEDTFNSDLDFDGAFVSVYYHF